MFIKTMSETGFGWLMFHSGATGKLLAPFHCKCGNVKTHVYRFFCALKQNGITTTAVD